MTPLFYDVPVLSTHASIVFDVFRPIFEATAEESKVHRLKIEEAMTSCECTADFTYGEVDLKGFLALLDCIQSLRRCEPVPSPLRSFVDLGCGLGKAVWLAAAFWPSLSSARGLDINPALVSDAQALLSRYHPAILSCRGAAVFQPPEDWLRVDCGDVCDDTVVWEDADVVFTYWNAMSESVKRVVARRARNLKTGSIVVTTRLPIPGTDTTCCAACRSGCTPECSNWQIVRQEWLDFERLPHETVIIHVRR
jgi:SAM-dependent methyltransferase